MEGNCELLGRAEDTPDEVIPETVSEFTGMLDKAGKEIYEHDIIEIYTPHTNFKLGFGVVNYEKGKFYFYGKTRNESDVFMSKELFPCIYDLSSSFNYKVVGNVFDDLNKYLGKI